MVHGRKLVIGLVVMYIDLGNSASPLKSENLSPNNVNVTDFYVKVHHNLHH